VRFVATDVADDASMRQTIDAAAASHGGLHILVCCAGD
jgi:NAD(P)-dependent dehydrogenase (short-subunit alcohol dehydrogenase family)